MKAYFTYDDLYRILSSAGYKTRIQTFIYELLVDANYDNVYHKLNALKNLYPIDLTGYKLPKAQAYDVNAKKPNTTKYHRLIGSSDIARVLPKEDRMTTYQMQQRIDYINSFSFGRDIDYDEAYFELSKYPNADLSQYEHPDKLKTFVSGVKPSSEGILSSLSLDIFFTDVKKPLFLSLVFVWSLIFSKNFFSNV